MCPPDVDMQLPCPTVMGSRLETTLVITAAGPLETAKGRLSLQVKEDTRTPGLCGSGPTGLPGLPPQVPPSRCPWSRLAWFPPWCRQCPGACAPAVYSSVSSATESSTGAATKRSQRPLLSLTAHTPGSTPPQPRAAAEFPRPPQTPAAPPSPVGT